MDQGLRDRLHDALADRLQLHSDGRGDDSPGITKTGERRVGLYECVDCGVTLVSEGMEACPDCGAAVESIATERELGQI